MVSWWLNDSYFNIEQIQISDIEIMISAYFQSVSFGSIVRYIYIGHNTYTVRRSDLGSKPTPIHGPVHKSGLKYSYSRCHFSCLPQAVTKILTFHLSQKVIYDSKIIDTDINGFITHEVRSHFQICDHSIVTSGIRGLCVGFQTILMLKFYTGLENQFLIRSNHKVRHR